MELWNFAPPQKPQSNRCDGFL